MSRRVPDSMLFMMSYTSVMALLLPAAFFAALDRGAEAGLQVGANGTAALISDTTRDKFLRMSRGIAIMLLLVSVSCSKTMWWVPHSFF
jgi:hypothetical protein